MQTTIKLFLMDGTATGRIKCSFSSGWSGLAYKIPVSEIDKCGDIEILKTAGIYFLFGYDEDDDTNEVVYIGQGNIRQNGQGVLYRVKEPHNQIPEWKTCVIFVSTGDAIGPTELNYLENKFTKLAQQSGRYIVKNGNTPNPSKLSEEDEADMKLFIDNSSIVLSTLGYRVIEPVITKKEKKILDDNTYTYRFGDKVAKGYINNEGFVLLKGSQLATEDKFAERWKEKLPKERARYADKIKDGITIDNIQFRSSSGAAKFCSGQSISGPKCWFDIKGISLEKRTD